MKKVIKFCKESLFSKLFFGLSYFDFAVIFVSFGIGIFLDWTILGSTFFAFAITTILRPFSSRQLATIALVLLLIIPILIFVKEFDRAEQFGFFVFYTLCLVAISAFSEYYKGHRFA